MNFLGQVFQKLEHYRQIHTDRQTVCDRNIIIIIIIIIMFVYYSCSHNATTEPTSVTQDSTDTIERKASIYIYATKHNTRLSTGILSRPIRVLIERR